MQGLPPPQMVGYHVSSGWGIPQQYHPPPKQPDQSYWATQLSENGLGLQGMDIRFVLIRVGFNSPLVLTFDTLWYRILPASLLQSS